MRLTTPRFTTPKLTNSQKANAGAVLVGLGSLLAQHSDDVMRAFPGIHWLAPALQIVALLVASLARSLATSNSGTGTGIINSGADLKAVPTVALPSTSVMPLGNAAVMPLGGSGSAGDATDAPPATLTPPAPPNGG